MFYHTLFPDTPALGATGGPRFATTVAPSPSGDEALLSHWPAELGAWDLVQQHRLDAETMALLALFRLACGRAHGFLYHDHDDDTGTAELLGIGDGVTTTFQLVKHYDQSSFLYSRTILKPLPGTVLPTLDGTPTTAFAVSSFTGLVTFDAAPALDVLVRASFRFYVPVRFNVDACDLTMVEPGITTWAGIRLVELPGGAEGEAVTDAVAPLELFGSIGHTVPDIGWVFAALLNWTLPDTGDAELLGYRLYRHADGEEFFVLAEATLVVDTTEEVDPLARTWTDPTTAEGGIEDGEHLGGYTYAVSVLTPQGESPPSNLIWLYLTPDVAPTLVATGTVLVGASAGTGYTTTHFLEATLTWTPAHFRGGEPVASTSLFRAFSPDTPSYLVGTFPSVLTYTEANIYGNYQGDDDGVHLVPVGTPGLDANIYEEVLRGDGYNYYVISTSVSGRTLTSTVVPLTHVILPPTAPLAPVATFHDIGDDPGGNSDFDRLNFSYIDWSLAAPANTYGAGVWWYDLEGSADGSTWSALTRNLETPPGMSTGDFGVTFSGNTSFADWDTDYYYRWRAVNDYGASPWSGVAHANGGPFVPNP